MQGIHSRFEKWVRSFRGRQKYLVLTNKVYFLSKLDDKLNNGHSKFQLLGKDCTKFICSVLIIYRQCYFDSAA